MNFATFDLNLLRVLEALFQEGSTVRAGERLGLSQPAVSGALSRLRHALDDPLFVRQGNRLVATARAEAMRHALADELERIEVLLSPPEAFRPDRAKGAFRIAGSDFFAEMLMPELGDKLAKVAPGVTAQLVELVPGRHLDSLLSERADLGLFPDEPMPDWAEHTPLFRSGFAVIAAPTNPAVAHMADWDTIPMDLFCALGHVLFSPEGNTRAMGDAALAAVGRTRKIALTVPVFSGVLRAVRQSDLIALVPAQLAEARARTDGLRAFWPPMAMPEASIVGVWHKRSHRAPLHAWMRDFVFDILRPLDAKPPR